MKLSLWTTWKYFKRTDLILRLTAMSLLNSSRILFSEDIDGLSC